MIRPRRQSEFQDFREFRNILAEDEKKLATAFTEKLLTFATGRRLGFSDRDEVERIVQSVASKRYRTGDLIQAVVTSKIFLNK